MEIDERKAAQIILSIGTHRKSRVLDPITVAEELQKLTKEMPRQEVARRFNIEDRTLRIYFKLLRLPESVKEIIRSNKIGQDMAYRLTFLDNPKDQESLVKAIIEYHLTNKEVRAIVQTLKRRNPGMPIEQCIKIAIKYRPRIEEDQFLLITELSLDAVKDLSSLAYAKNISLSELVKQIVSKSVPADSLSSVGVRDRIVILSLDKRGNRVYKATAKKLHVKEFELLDALAKDWVRSHAD